MSNLYFLEPVFYFPLSVGFSLFTCIVQWIHFQKSLFGRQYQYILVIGTFITSLFHLSWNIWIAYSELFWHEQVNQQLSANSYLVQTKSPYFYSHSSYLLSIISATLFFQYIVVVKIWDYHHSTKKSQGSPTFFAIVHSLSMCELMIFLQAICIVWISNTFNHDDNLLLKFFLQFIFGMFIFCCTSFVVCQGITNRWICAATFLLLFLFEGYWFFGAKYIQADVNYIRWVIRHLFSETLHLIICCYWLGCIGLIAIVILNTQMQRNEKQLLIFGLPFPKIILRKFFHFMSIAMFIPGTILFSDFMYLCYGLAFGLFILLEFVRILFAHRFSLVQKFDSLLKRFTDERDARPLILTHVYLLFGCAIPLWLVHYSNIRFRFPTSADFYMTTLCGVVLLGMGDTMASIIGLQFGKTKWYEGTKKSIEGTLGAFLSVTLMQFIVVLVEIYLHEQVIETTWSKVSWGAHFYASLVGCILEALTLQIDNLTIPFIYVFIVLCSV